MGDRQTQFCLGLCGVSGSWCAQGLFELFKPLWQVWGLILDSTSPLLLSCWGFSALGRGVSPPYSLLWYYFIAYSISFQCLLNIFSSPLLNKSHRSSLPLDSQRHCRPTDTGSHIPRKFLCLRWVRNLQLEPPKEPNSAPALAWPSCRASTLLLGAWTDRRPRVEAGDPSLSPPPSPSLSSPSVSWLVALRATDTRGR